MSWISSDYRDYPARSDLGQQLGVGTSVHAAGDRASSWDRRDVAIMAIPWSVRRALVTALCSLAGIALPAVVVDRYSSL